MSVIYKPRGKALEYSPLACNLYTGCSHACKYCYCPSIMRKTLQEWSENPYPRKNIIKQIEKEAQKLKGTKDEILFSFMSDPYQNDESAMLTRQALEICEKYNLNPQILTKAGKRASKDFDIIKKNNWKFGSTIIFKSEKFRQEWEPGAPSIKSRYDSVKQAYDQNIFTWISVEPVIDADEALEVIYDLKDFVSFWKLGKLNHFKNLEEKVNWKDYLKQAEKIL